MRAAPTRRRRRQPPPPAAAASQSARLAPLWPSSVCAARLGRPWTLLLRAGSVGSCARASILCVVGLPPALVGKACECSRACSERSAREQEERELRGNGVRRRTPWARARADVEPERPDARPPPDGGEDDVRPAAEGHGPCPTARPTAPNAAKRGRVFSHRGRCLRGVVLGAVPVPACSSAQFAS